MEGALKSPSCQMTRVNQCTELRILCSASQRNKTPDPASVILLWGRGGAIELNTTNVPIWFNLLRGDTVCVCFGFYLSRFLLAAPVFGAIIDVSVIVRRSCCPTSLPGPPQSFPAWQNWSQGVQFHFLWPPPSSLLLVPQSLHHNLRFERRRHQWKPCPPPR